MCPNELVGRRGRGCDKPVKGRTHSLGSRAVNAYHVCGVVFAIWAVLVSFVGITREDFPATRARRASSAMVSVLLALATIGSAIYIGATEEDDEGGGAETAARALSQ